MTALVLHFGWTWIAPGWLVAGALALIAIALAGSSRAHRASRRPAALLFAGASFAGASGAPLPSTWRTRLLPWLPRVDAVALLLAFAALARPVVLEPLRAERSGIDVVLVVDLSSSMQARDLDPMRTRLDVARAAAADFARARADDRLALVTFARYPDVRCPLTLDHNALADALARLAPVAADGPEDATALGRAIACAGRLLRDSSARSKVVVLLTDGDENVASAHASGEIAPVVAADWCHENGIRIDAIVAGIGRPDGNGGFAPLDTRQLRLAAERTGGRFFAARDADALAAIYARIDALEKVPFEEPRVRVLERFAPLLIAAVALLASSRVLRATMLQVAP